MVPLIYDKESMAGLARKAGVDDVEAFSRKFLPALVLPLAVLWFSPLASLAILLALLRLPHLTLWYMSKERQKAIRRELPLFVSSLKWLLEVYPVPEAVCSLEFGEVSRALGKFCESYKRGESFENALFSCAVFPELEELARRLVVVYRTGSGQELLDLYSDRISTENLSRVRTSAARMQIFAVAYTALVAVLPAMHSGLSLYGGGDISLPSLLAGLGLVVLWKLID